MLQLVGAPASWACDAYMPVTIAVDLRGEVDALTMPKRARVESAGSAGSPSTTAVAAAALPTAPTSNFTKLKLEEGRRRAADGAEMPQKKFFRMRAHINPLSQGMCFQ
jgi:hypothetical protein